MQEATSESKISGTNTTKKRTLCTFTLRPCPTPLSIVTSPGRWSMKNKSRVARKRYSAAMTVIVWRLISVQRGSWTSARGGFEKKCLRFTKRFPALNDWELWSITERPWKWRNGGVLSCARDFLRNVSWNGRQKLSMHALKPLAAEFWTFFRHTFGR